MIGRRFATRFKRLISPCVDSAFADLPPTESTITHAELGSITSTQFSTLGNEMTAVPKAASKALVRQSRNSARLAITAVVAAVDPPGETSAGTVSLLSGSLRELTERAGTDSAPLRRTSFRIFPCRQGARRTKPLQPWCA